MANFLEDRAAVEESPLAKKTIMDLSKDLHIGEALDAGVGELQMQAGGNSLRQGLVAVPSQDFHRVIPTER